MKLFGGSKIVALNAVTIITSLLTYLGYATGFLHFLLPASIVAIAGTAIVVLTEILNYFFPSGTFIGSGQNWTPVKWILNIAMVSLAFLQANDIVALIPQATLIPIIAAINLIIRIFGGATHGQIKAADGQTK